MSALELTEEEVAHIKQRREKEEARKAVLKKRLDRIMVAHDYEKWLQDKGRGSTFSTFVNEFGYDELDSSEVYGVVEAIRGALG